MSESNEIKSVSVTIGPRDNRCRHWEIIVRKGVELPMPNSIEGASSLPAKYCRNGDEELFEGDFLFEGEENHHRKNHGWSYWIHYVGADGKLKTVQPTSEIKAALKAAGIPNDLLPGSGGIPGIVRIAHGIRLGISI